MINPEALEEWLGNPITRQVMGLLKEEKQKLLEAMGYGHFFNPESMEESFGNTAKNIGVIEGIDTFFNLLAEAKDADD